MQRPATFDIALLPEPADGERARAVMADLLEKPGEDASRAALRALAEAHEPVMRLLLAICGASPYLAGLIARHPDVALETLETGAGPCVDRAIAEAQAAATAETEAAVMAALRRAKEKASLAIGLADVAGLWPVMEVTDALTRFADAALAGAVGWLLLQAERDGTLALADRQRPAVGCGYVVLAMGKYGAFELNYSSDIDLIVLYDPETAPFARDTESATFFVRMTRRLVKLLQERTGDGYVFRVDLRLRPDPRATNVAIAIEAAAQYYESLGQNWERAAMIKVRPCGGDLELGREFVGRLTPFIWRKYLDYASIADVHSMKRQIHAFKGHGEIAVAGHNIKLGRGGIREIEFFVQTQQLIAGGRAPKLRSSRTLDMLEILAANEWITPQVAAEMRDAYLFLRTVEHRLQMQADDQTHTLPAEQGDLAAFARFAGYGDVDDFAQDLLGHMRRVQGHYAALFEHAPSLGSDTGSLVFTGGEDDPDTIETLRGMGFAEPSEVSAAIRGWHFGRYAATRSARARERLTEIMPVLLAALARTSDPDAAFLSFDRFLGGLPAGVQLFSLLWSNPNLLELIAGIMGTAPRLAGLLSKRPQVLDAVLDPGFFGALPDRETFDALVTAPVRAAGSFEASLDRARVLGQEQAFRIGVKVLTGTADAVEAGAAYSALADSAIAGLFDAVAEEITEQHGRLPGAAAVVVAMGKLGGREMTAASDVDLMLIYDFDEDANQSDGRRPLSPTQYYARFTQRLIAALSAPTAEGHLYDVDMRLRPSGNSGPIATRIGSFVEYQRESAWTWEKLALTRARVAAGDPNLHRRFAEAITGALAHPRDRAATARDVVDMRARLDKEKGSDDPWELKFVRGGLVDLEFIAQYLQVTRAADSPSILDPNTASALAKLAAAGSLEPGPAADLQAACRLLHALTQVIRLCVDGRFELSAASGELRNLLCKAGDEPDISRLESTLRDTESRVKSLFDQIVEGEA